jgi:acetate kinase
VCAGLAWAGLRLDDAANQAASGAEVKISAAGSTIDAWVMHVDEATVIARETVALLSGGEGQSHAADR